MFCEAAFFLVFKYFSVSAYVVLHSLSPPAGAVQPTANSNSFGVSQQSIRLPKSKIIVVIKSVNKKFLLTIPSIGLFFAVAENNLPAISIDTTDIIKNDGREYIADQPNNATAGQNE